MTVLTAYALLLCIPKPSTNRFYPFISLDNFTAPAAKQLSFGCLFQTDETRKVHLATDTINSKKLENFPSALHVVELKGTTRVLKGVQM